MWTILKTNFLLSGFVRMLKELSRYINIKTFEIIGLGSLFVFYSWVQNVNMVNKSNMYTKRILTLAFRKKFKCQMWKKKSLCQIIIVHISCVGHWDQTSWNTKWNKTATFLRIVCVWDHSCPWYHTMTKIIFPCKNQANKQSWMGLLHDSQSWSSQTLVYFIKVRQTVLLLVVTK